MNSTRGVPCRVRIVGLGSPFGDDRGGWEVVDQLRGALPLGGRAETVSDPLAVLDCPLGCELLVVIDVCRGAGSAGSCHRFVWPDPRLIAGGGVSSHGIGLASALELAAALGQLPPRVIVFAIEGDSAEPGANLSQVIKTAVPEIVSRVLAEFADNSDVPVTESRMNEVVTPGLLKTLAFFTPATDDELHLLIPATRVEQYSTGAMLFREGDHLPHVFVVVAGTVALEVSGPDHRSCRFQTVGPGELLGWSPLLGGGAMTASSRAVTDVKVLAIDAKAILAVCDQDPRFGYQFMRRTAAAIAARLSATRLQLLDVYKHELPTPPPTGEQ